MMKSIRILPAVIAVPLALAACGSQTHTTSPSTAHRTSSGAQASTTAAATRSTTSAASATTAAAPQGGSSENAIAKINDAFKHMTPQQRQALKARIPAYMHAMEQCAKANGGAQAATLACMQSHGFGTSAP